MEIHDKIILYLFEFRNDSEYHDLFEKFEQGDYEVILDRVNSLNGDKLVEIQPEVYIGWGGPPKPKHDLFARITKKGIEHVKTGIISQKQKDKDERRRFLITTVISIAFLVATAFGIYLTDKTNRLEQNNLKINKENDSLRAVNAILSDELRLMRYETNKLKVDTTK